MTPSRMSTASAAPAAQDGREPRCCSSRRGAPLCPCDREGDAAAADRDRPALGRGRQRSARGAFRRLDHREPRFGQPGPVPRARGELCARQRRGDGRHRCSAGARDARRWLPDGTRSAPASARRANPLRARTARGRFVRDLPDRRWAQAEGHPGAIVGAIANEGGLSRGDFGNISIATTSRSSSCPPTSTPRHWPSSSTPASDATPSTCGETWARRAPVGGRKAAPRDGKGGPRDGNRRSNPRSRAVAAILKPAAVDTETEPLRFRGR